MTRVVIPICMSLYAVLLSLLLGVLGQAKPLSSDDLRPGTRVGVIRTPLDPVSNRALRWALEKAKEHHWDYVVLYPTWIQNPYEPLSVQLDLLENAIQGSPILRSPSAGYFSDLGNKENWQQGWEAFRLHYSHYIKEEVQPDSEITEAESELHGFFFSHPEIFLAPPSAESLLWLKERMPSATTDRILKEHKYFAIFPAERGMDPPPRPRWWKDALVPALRNIGFLFSAQLVYRGLKGKNGVAPPMDFPEGLVPDAFLASGGRSNVYVIRIENKLYALKLPADSGAYHVGINRRDSLFFHWLQQRAEPGYLPQLAAYDPQGHWMLSEYVDGTTLADVLVQRRVDWNEERTQSLSRLIAFIQRISDTYGFMLDLSPYNIVLVGNEAKLVDAGPLPWHYQKQLQLKTPLWDLMQRWRNELTLHFANQRYANCVSSLLSIGHPEIRVQYQNRVQQMPIYYRKHLQPPDLTNPNHFWRDLPADAVRVLVP